MKKAFPVLMMAGLFLAACQQAGKNTAEQKASAESTVLAPEEQQAFRAKGKAIAQATFAELSGELATALEEGGVEGALRYCNLAAYPLVDSLSRVHDAVIRRTSLKVRNPEDQPTAVELEVLNGYHQQQEGELTPRVMLIGEDQVAFFAPIKIQPLCLNCHGKIGEDPGIKTDDYAIIKELYPADEATGYELNDLRGMWSITFKR